MNQTNTVINLIKAIQHRRQNFKIGVICLYNGQKEEIIKDVFKHSRNVIVSSVDAFQGTEADIIIVVTSRTCDLYDNVFFNLQERVTVAMTRVQRGLIFVGDKDVLKSAPSWRKIVKKLESLNAVYKNIPYKEKPKTTYATAAAKQK